MPSPRRIIPNVPVHITQRGVNRCTTFHAEEDFGVYLWMLEGVKSTARCAVHAYVLMTNHVHLLISPADAAAPARLMRMLGIRYVRYFNARYRRTGTLWEGRYRSKVVETDAYFFACSRYIELNPVRAGITDDPALYAWSSFRRNALGENDRIISPHPLHAALGPDPVARARAYRRLFAQDSPPTVVAAIRTAPHSRRPSPEIGDHDGRAPSRDEPLPAADGTTLRSSLGAVRAIRRVFRKP